MARILVVEDEKDLQDVLAYNLKQAGHDVLQAVRGSEGLRLARERKPDLVLLDLMLPDVSGTEVCRTLKSEAATRTIPVVMVTAKGEEVDRIVGLELGADDYVTKPFSVRELMLRVKALLRRSTAPVAPAEVVEFGKLRVDRAAHRVEVSGREIELTHLEYKLLNTLLDRKDRVQSRETLLDVVWGIQADVTTRTVDTHVKRLREKLGGAGEYVETVRGAGYRFAGAARR